MAWTGKWLQNSSGVWYGPITSEAPGFISAHISGSSQLSGDISSSGGIAIPVDISADLHGSGTLAVIDQVKPTSLGAAPPSKRDLLRKKIKEDDDLCLQIVLECFIMLQKR